MIISFLSFSHKLLIKQKKEETFSLKMKLNRELNCKFVSSDEEGGDDDEGDGDDGDVPISKLYYN